MNREEIIKLAREADACHDNVQVTPFLERFAALVAEKEREACAKECEQWGIDIQVETWDMAGKDCASAIRAKKP